MSFNRIRPTSGVSYLSNMYQENVIYHVYNQSNNYETIFRSEENYLFFTEKIRTLILPYADVLCYCLMPDHFHLLLKPKESGCGPSPSKKIPKQGEEASSYQQMLSHQIKILLSSYTKAFNRRYKRRGSLFRAKTKAKPGYSDFLPAEFDIEANIPFTQFIPYLCVCFRYIHNNPVKADYALHATEWEFSSACDYAGMRDHKICNYQLTEHLLGIQRLKP